MTKRKLLDATDGPAREKVKGRLSKMIWSALSIFLFTCPGFFSAWNDLRVLHWMFIVCGSITYVGFAYEVYMTWCLKQWFDRTGARSFDELITHAA